jgi:RNA polymerase sigma-70 factor (sigma-E family)
MDVVVSQQQAPTFDEWVTSRVPGLLRFAYLVTGSQDAAEEAVQTALTKACEQWPRIRRTTEPDTYVRRMVANAHVSAWRRFGRRVTPVAEVHESRPGREQARDLADTVVGDDAVWRVCTSLPRQQRAAVVLRFYEDLDYAEIAATLEISEVTARSHVHRGLARLRTELEREGESDHG